jgi:RNA-directed DNA polymerase
MMHDPEKSDSSIVPVKPANKAGQPAAELAEGRGGIERNADTQSKGRAQNRGSLSQARERIREAAARNRQEKLTTLLHHVTPEALEDAFRRLRKDAAPGVDGVTWEDYATDLTSNLEGLCGRVHTGAYRAQPSRRKYIPKPDGRQRPLGIAALEDKIVQQAVVDLLTPIYEEEFLGFSYGFRPGRGQHDALDALAVGIEERRIHWILDAGHLGNAKRYIQAFFDHACWYPLQQPVGMENWRFWISPAHSRRKLSSVSDVSGKRYSLVAGSRLTAMVPLWMRS